MRIPRGNRRARCPKANAISAQFLLNQNNLGRGGPARGAGTGTRARRGPPATRRRGPTTGPPRSPASRAPTRRRGRGPAPPAAPATRRGCRAELAGPGVEGGRAALAAAEHVAPAVDHPPEVARLPGHPAVDPPRGHEPRVGPVAPPRAAREHGGLPMR